MLIDYEKESMWLLYQCGIRVNTQRKASNIDLLNIVRRLRVEYREFPMDGEMGGVWMRSDDLSVTPHYIFINSAHPAVRKRFSLGHEIGHYWLGHDSDFSLESDHSTEKERQADHFSAALNMPKDSIYEKHCSLSTVRQIAAWFRVSDVSCALRLLYLGLRREEAELVVRHYYDGGRVATHDEKLR